MPVASSLAQLLPAHRPLEAVVVVERRHDEQAFLVAFGIDVVAVVDDGSVASVVVVAVIGVAFHAHSFERPGRSYGFVARIVDDVAVGASFVVDPYY